MPDEPKRSDQETDDGMGLPSRMILFALATLGILLLALASSSSDRVTPAPQRGATSAKVIETSQHRLRELDQDASPR